MTDTQREAFEAKYGKKPDSSFKKFQIWELKFEYYREGWQAALAHSQQTADMALLEKIQALPRYSFLLNSSGGVTRYADKSGAWIERYEVIKLIDKR